MRTVSANRILLVLVALCCAAALSLSGLLPPARAQLRGYLDIVQAALTSSGTEPLPIRRLQVPADRVLIEMERARQGKWIHLTREEFEAKVTRAREVGDALKKPPQLLEARYRAVLDGNALTGSGQWVVVNPAPLAGVLSLQPFTLALRSARLDGKDAVLGDLDGKNLGLLVEQTGKHIFSLDWSARGEQGPAGLRFRLEVPPCALTSLELELPADHELVSFMDRVTCLVSGPKPATVPQRRLWRLECPEPSPLEMLIRPVSTPGQAPPVVLASLRSRQDLRPNLRPGQFGAEFDISLEVLHGALRDLVCQCDPALWPVSVRMRNQEIEGWDLRPGKTPESPSTLTIRLPEPIQGRAPTLRISCQATAVPGQPWRSPGLHVVGAVPRGETLALQIPPDFELHRWQPGDFELRRTSADAEGGQILSLRSGLRDPGAVQRPSALLTLQHVETKVRGLTWWHVRKEQTSLTAQFNYEVTRGQLFHLLVRVPAGWQVDRVDLNPPALLRNWTITSQSQASSLLQVDLESPLRPSSAARLTVELRGSPAKQEAGDGLALPFPALIPENAGRWEGALAIVIDPSLHAIARASIPAIPPPSLRESGGGAVGDSAPDFPGVSAFPLAPWSAQAPDYYYAYRGQPVTGTLQLRPRPARLHARCDSDVTVGPGRATLRTSLRLEPAIGAADTIDLASSAPLPATWRWKSASAGNAVRAVKQLSLVEAAPRFLALGCSSGLEVLNLLHVPGAPVSLWRLTLAQPLHEPITLEGMVDLNEHRPGSPQHQGRWEIPLMTVLSAERMAGEVRLHLADRERIDVNSTGLQESSVSTPSGGLAPWRTFRYGRGPISLSLGNENAADRPPAPAYADQAQLSTYVEANDRLLSQFRFVLRNWQQRTLPVRLPTGARLLVARLDGRWLRYPEAEQRLGGDSVVELPLNSGTVAQHLELIYAMDMPSWRLWTRVESPAPLLPLPIESFARTWCVPPGVAPFDERRLELLPGRGSPYEEWPNVSAHALGNAVPSETPAQTWRVRQQRLVADANTRRRKAAGQDRQSLRALLEDLIFDVFKGQEAVLVDTRALEEAALDPSTVVKAGVSGDHALIPADKNRILEVTSLAGASLACVACPAGPLLTSRRQWQDWTLGDEQNRQLPDAVESAVAEAARYGQDASGRFRNALDWLGQQEYAAAGRAAPLTYISLGEVWTAWKPIPGDAGESTLLIVRPATLTGLSWMLVLTFVLAAWRARKHPGRGRYGLLLAWLLCGGLAVLWFPGSIRPFVWPPFLVAVVVAGAWYLLSAIRPRHRPTSKAVASAASILLALAALAALPGQAAAPASHSVLLLPGPADAPDKQTVLAPPDLLEQLRVLAKRGAQGLQGAALLSAHYDGSVADGVAVLESAFGVYAFAEEATTITVPLSGVELQDAKLDGMPAYPVALAPTPAGAGYSLQVKGRGIHKIQLRFAARLTVSGADQELRCSIPDVAQSRLTLVVPSGATYLQSVSGRGAQRALSRDAGVVLEADLGRVNTLGVRWRQEKTPPPEQVQVDECYLWDLRATGALLHGALQYTVNQGAPTTLKVALPLNMEISQVRTGASPAGAATPRLKKWQVVSVKDEHVLQLEFSKPVTARVQIYLDLVSRLPLAPSVAVALPAPVNTGPTGNSYLGYRVEGRKAEPVEFNHLTGIQPEEFNALWRELDTDERGTAVERAYSFRRTPAGGPVLRLHLQPLQPQVNCLQTVTWLLSAQRANLQATARLTTAKDDLCLVEWAVPAPVVVTSIDGPNVRSWSRSGDQLQIWLRKSVKATTLQLFGWLEEYSKNAGDSFHLPSLRIVGAASQWTRLQLSTDSNVILVPGPLQNLWQVPALRASSRERNYVTQQSTYGATFQVKAALPTHEVRALTLAQTRERELSFTSTLDFNVRQGELRAVTVRLRNWTGSQLRLQAPRVSARRENQPDAATHVWSLELQPGVTGPYALTLSGVMSLDAAPEMLMPDVSVDEAPEAERLLVTAGSNLVVEDTRGLVALADTAQALERWPNARAQVSQAGGSAWKVIAEDWKLRLRPSQTRVAAKPVRIFHQEFAAAVRDGQHWEYQAAYWLYQEAGADLHVLLPRAGHLVRALLDRKELVPVKSEPGLVVLPLAGGNGVHSLRLSWAIVDESLERPSFTRPRLEDAAGVPIPVAKHAEAATLQPVPSAQQNPAPQGAKDVALWRIQLPAGYQAIQEDGEADSAAAQDLNRAAALLDLCRHLAERSKGTGDAPSVQELDAAERQFYRACRHAQYRLALAGHGRQVPARSALLSTLLQNNKHLAEASHFEKSRADAENIAALHPLSADTPGQEPVSFLATGGTRDFQDLAGTPTYWLLPDGAAGQALRFTPLRLQQLRRAFALSSVVVMLCLIAWLLTYSPRLLSAARFLWPEQIALVGFIGWQSAGFHAVFALLIFFALSARLVYVGSWLSDWLNRWTSRSAPSTSS